MVGAVGSLAVPVKARASPVYLSSLTSWLSDLVQTQFGRNRAQFGPI